MNSADVIFGLILTLIAALVVGVFWSVGKTAEYKNLCKQKHGVYITARDMTPVCVDEKVVIPL